MSRAVSWSLVLVAFLGLIAAILWPTRGQLHPSINSAQREAILKAYFYELSNGLVIRPAFGAEINGSFAPQEPAIRFHSTTRISVYTGPHDLVVYTVDPEKLYGARSAFTMIEAYQDGQPVEPEAFQP